MREYTTKVDALIGERKEAKQAVEAQHEAVRQQVRPPGRCVLVRVD